MKRYHPALVTLHWLLALMILFGLVIGGEMLEHTPNSDPEKINMLRIHMGMGLAILALTLLRLVIRKFTQNPIEADSGNAQLNTLSHYTHYALYAFVILLAASGIGISILSGLPDIVFGGIGNLPENFDSLLPRTVHGLASKVLMATIILHVLGFLYHQFVRKDGLFSRMWFGKRT